MVFAFRVFKPRTNDECLTNNDLSDYESSNIPQVDGGEDLDDLDTNEVC